MSACFAEEESTTSSEEETTRPSTSGKIQANCTIVKSIGFPAIGISFCCMYLSLYKY